MTLEFTNLFFVLEFLSSCCSEDMQDSLFNPAHTGLDRCQIIKYARLSNSTYTVLNSYR